MIDGKYYPGGDPFCRIYERGQPGYRDLHSESRPRCTGCGEVVEVVRTGFNIQFGNAMTKDGDGVLVFVRKRRQKC